MWYVRVNSLAVGQILNKMCYYNWHQRTFTYKLDTSIQIPRLFGVNDSELLNLGDKKVPWTFNTEVTRVLDSKFKEITLEEAVDRLSKPWVNTLPEFRVREQDFFGNRVRFYRDRIAFDWGSVTEKDINDLINEWKKEAANLTVDSSYGHKTRWYHLTSSPAVASFMNSLAREKTGKPFTYADPNDIKFSALFMFPGQQYLSFGPASHPPKYQSCRQWFESEGYTEVSLETMISYLNGDIKASEKIRTYGWGGFTIKFTRRGIGFEREAKTFATEHDFRVLLNQWYSAKPYLKS